MELSAKRDALFAHYNRGAITATEVEIEFIEVLLLSENDADALELCCSLPRWFRERLYRSLVEQATVGYGRRWFAMGDIRTREQIEDDARRHGALLERIGPQIIQMLQAERDIQDT